MCSLDFVSVFAWLRVNGKRRSNCMKLGKSSSLNRRNNVQLFNCQIRHGNSNETACDDSLASAFFQWKTFAEWNSIEMNRRWESFTFNFSSLTFNRIPLSMVKQVNVIAFVFFDFHFVRRLCVTCWCVRVNAYEYELVSAYWWSNFSCVRSSVHVSNDFR